MSIDKHSLLFDTQDSRTRRELTRWYKPGLTWIIFKRCGFYMRKHVSKSKIRLPLTSLMRPGGGDGKTIRLRKQSAAQMACTHLIKNIASIFLSSALVQGPLITGTVTTLCVWEIPHASLVDKNYQILNPSFNPYHLAYNIKYLLYSF